jgi:hypothetical protein
MSLAWTGIMVVSASNSQRYSKLKGQVMNSVTYFLGLNLYNYLDRVRYSLGFVPF